MSNKRIEFTDIIRKMPASAMGAWSYIDFPEDAFEIFGKRGFVRVKGFINGKAYKSNLFPKGNSQYAITLPLRLQKELKISLHQEITISVEEDLEERMIPMPTELQEVIDEDEEFAALYNKLSVAMQNYYRTWIGAGKHPETRIRRVVQLFERLSKPQK